jgi:hypothetical protein
MCVGVFGHQGCRHIRGDGGASFTVKVGSDLIPLALDRLLYRFNQIARRFEADTSKWTADLSSAHEFLEVQVIFSSTIRAAYNEC